jgi:hypothetical protein
VDEYTRTGLFARFRAAAEGDEIAWDAPVRASNEVPDDVARAVTLAIEAVRWFAQPGGTLPDVDEAETFVDASPAARDFAGRAVARAARAAVLSFDAEKLALWNDVHERLVKPGDADEGALSLHAGRGWASVLAGDADAAKASADALRKEATRASHAALVVESATLRAAAEAVAGNLEEATSLARRASRMSRTESLPQEEYFANLLLARVRRLGGKTHLATRILAALLRVATPPWQSWMSWELLLAGAEVGADGTGTSSDDPSHGLRAILHAARRGDIVGFDAHVSTLRSRLAAVSLLTTDFEVLVPLLDPRAPVPAALTAWTTGAQDEVPLGLASFGLMTESADEAALVVTAPSPRRFLAPGLGLVKAGEVVRVAPAPGRQARTEATIAALLLAGPAGHPEDALFQRIYGFPYETAIHRGVRDVLYHRVRHRLEGIAELVREDGRVALSTHATIIAADPRCSPPPEHALLTVLATAGHASAKDAAEALGVPVRTAQDALRRLADDGACRAVKVGRRLEYHIEDTTFLEPTKV